MSMSPRRSSRESTLSHVLVNEFADHVFWDELISRLSVRDAAQTVGGMDRLNALNESDRQATEGLIRKHYIGEFSRNGLTNVAVIDRFGVGGEEPIKMSD